MTYINKLSNNFNEKFKLTLNNDDVSLLSTVIHSRLRIDGKKIMIYAVGNGLIKVIKFIAYHKINEFNSLSSKEKILLFKMFFYNFSNDNTFFYDIIHTLLNNGKFNNDILSYLFFLSIKYGKIDLMNMIKGKIKLSNKLLKDFLSDSKETKLNEIGKKEFIIYMCSLMKERKNSLYQLLSLSLSTDMYQECIEIEIFQNLNKEEQLIWANYLMKSDNLKFHFHQVLLEAKKKDGYNEYDINIDFLKFFCDNVLILLTDLSKENETKLTRLKNSIKKDTIFTDLTLPFIHKIDIVLLNNKLNKNLQKEKKELKELRKI